MIQVDIDLLVLPDWGWHVDSTEATAKLTASLTRHGQTQSLLVRTVVVEIENETSKMLVPHYEIIDGRRRLHILRQLGVEQVWVCDLGQLTREEVITHALSLDLTGEIDYARLAVWVKSLVDTDGFTSLPMCTPFTADRLRYLVDLTDFDWSQYSAGDEQVNFFEDVDTPRPAPKTVTPETTSAPKQPRAPKTPSAPALPSPDAANDVAARLAARTAASGLSTVTAPDVPRPDERRTEPSMLQKAVMAAFRDFKPSQDTDKTTQSFITLGDDNTPKVIEGWRPDAPPDLSAFKELQLDTETNGLKWWAGDRPIGISVKTPDGRRQYLPWGHAGGNLDETLVRDWARRELRGKHLSGANTRFDVHMLREWGVDLEAQDCTVEDVQHTAALLDEYRKEFALDALGRDYLGRHKVEGLDKTRMAGYHASQVAEYACVDVDLVDELQKIFKPLVAAEDLGRVQQLESDVIYPVCEMEKNGAHVNRQGLIDALASVTATVDKIVHDIARDVGFQMNPDKNADWERLFQHYQIPITHYTEPSKQFPQGQPSFKDAYLAGIEHPVVQLARKAGKLESIKSKFLSPYVKLVGSDNLLRFALHQLRGDEYGTVRGRFSMSGSSKGVGQFGANLQQVMSLDTQREAFGYDGNDASHDEEIYMVRSFFEAASFVRFDGSDTEYLSCDAQAIEYRLAAHFADSEQLIEAYQADTVKLQRGDLTSGWVDFHQVVMDVIKPYKTLTRKRTKNVNFGFIYGSGIPTASKTIGVSIEETVAIEAIYSRLFPELRGRNSLSKKAQTLAETRGYVKTILGRRARFPTKEFAHAALNYVIQGSAADIMKQKLVDLHRERKWTEFLMRMTVHDEVDGDARHPETAARVRQILNRQSFKLKVPIVWEVGTGRNWAQAH